MGKVVVRFLLIAFFCSLFASCTTKRLTIREEKENVTHAKYERFGEFDLFADLIREKISVRMDSLIQNQKIHFVLYDTDKTDSDGSHPVKMEGDIETDTKQGSKTETDDSLKVDANVISKDNENFTLNDSLVQKKDEEQERTSTKATDFTSLAFLLLVILSIILSIRIYKH